MSYTKYSMVHDMLISNIRYIKAMRKFKTLDSFYNGLVNGALFNVRFIYINRHKNNLHELCSKNLKVSIKDLTSMACSC